MLNVSHPSHYDELRIRLQEEFVSRCKSNPRYSLRAFSKFLNVDFSLLSKIIRGQRPITKKTFKKVTDKLGLSPEEISAIVSKNIIGSSDRQNNYQQLTLDHFHMVADWYHYAIFELVAVKGFQSSPKWIAQTLGISQAEAQAAIDRLIRLDLIEYKGARLIRSTDHITTVGNEFTASAFRKLQTQVLSMGIKAMEEIPIAVRDQSSMTMAINTKRIPEFKEKIKSFRRELCRVAESDSTKDHVYQLGISLYPVTRSKNKEFV